MINADRHFELYIQTRTIHNKSFFWITTIVCFALFLLPKNIFAADSTITAIPPRLEINAEPGETIKSILKVRNDTGTQQNFTVTVSDFIVDQQTNTPVPLSENITSRWSLRKWITNPKYLPVDSGQTQTLEVVIRVPASALPGGHYAMITYMPNGDIAPGEMRKTATIIGQRVGTIIYVNVKGKVNEKANLTSFEAPKFTEKGPVKFSGSLENLSDTHINPQGSIIIKDILGKEVAKIPLNLGNIFPENIKNFQTAWNQKWGYGRYSAEINLIYGQSNVVTGLIYFWLFPITAVIYSLVALVSMLIIITALSHRNKKHQLDLEKEVQKLQQEIQNLEKR